MFTLILALFSTAVFADLDQANQLFISGKILDARDLYRSAWKSGSQSSEDFFRNWGVVEWKSGDKVYAYAAFLKANQLNPSDAQIKNMLTEATKALDQGAAIIKAPKDQWFANLTMDSVAEELLWMISLTCLASGLYLLSLGNYLRPEIYLAALLSFCFGILAIANHNQKNISFAVIVDPQAKFFSGPGESFSSMETLPVGATAEVISKNGDWAQIRYTKGDKQIYLTWVMQKSAIIN